MGFRVILQYGTLWSLITAAGSVVFAMVSHRRQVNASIYLDLTSRLQKLYQSIPQEMRSSYFTAEVETPPGVAVLDFLNLLNAAFTLFKSGYFSGPLWKALEAEAQHGLQTPLFRTQWPLVRQDFNSSPQFVQYIDQVQTTSAARHLP